MAEHMSNNTRSAVAEATRFCRERGIKVSNTLLAFVVRTIAVQDPAKYKLDAPMTMSTLRHLAEASAERVSVVGDAAVESIKMEVEVEQEYIAQGKKLHEEAKNKDEDTMSQEFSITSSRYRSEKDDSEFFTELYRKVFTYVASGHGMETALTDPEAEAETLAALDSVFPQHGLRRFLSLGREDKAAQLKELRAIVLGIRIFNRLIGKGSQSLADPVAPFEEQATSLVNNLKSMIVDAQQELDQYEMVLEAKGITFRPNLEPMPMLRAVHSNRLVFLDLSLFLLEQVEKGLNTVHSLSVQYEAEQRAVQELVGAKVAVPKEKVYPKLEALGTLHTLLLQDHRMLNVLSRVTDKLQQFHASFEPVITMKDVQEAQNAELVGALLNDLGPPPSPDPLSAAEEEGAKLLLWEDACEVGSELPALRCGGFSVVTAVKRGGFLLRASPEASVVQWQEGLYGFVNEDEAEAFAAAPKAYMDALHQVVMVTPELVRLLRLEDVVPSLRMADIVEVMLTPLTCDYATQTPTHFVEKNIDRNYEWNEWALRRRVLQLANLRQMRTHSTQTTLSHFRREQETQNWLPKESFTQTSSQKGTTMPQKKMYVEGLRGPPDVRMQVVNVDLNLGQPHEY